MPVQVSYPGLYIQEIPSSAHTVTGVSTSATAFVDFFPSGPVNQAVQCNCWNDVQRTFGGLDPRSESSYGLLQYFLNGGQVAWVIRLADAAAVTAAAAGAIAVTAPAGMMAATSQPSQPITVAWTPTGSVASASPAPTYTLLLSTDGGQSFKPITPTAAPANNQATFTLSPVPTATTAMVVRVVATDANGNTLASGDSGQVTLVPAVLAITAPAKGATVDLPNQLPLAVAWGPPPAGTAGQSVLLSTDNGATFKPVPTSPPALNGTAVACTIPQITTPAAAQSAVLQIVARDAMGNVTAFGSQAFTLQVQPLVVTAPGGAAVTLPLAQPLPVNWNAPAVATAVASYAVLLSTDNGKTWSSAVTSPAQIPAATLACTIAQIPTPATPQKGMIRVVALDKNGATVAAGDSAAFTLGPASLAVSAPPAGTVTLPAGLPLNVAWTAPAPAPATPVAGYAVYLSTDGGVTYTPATTAPAALDAAAVACTIPQITTPAAPQQAMVAVVAQDATGAPLAAGTSPAFTLSGASSAAAPASPAAPAGPTFTLAAANPGVWGNSLVAVFQPAQAIGPTPPPAGVFNLTVQRMSGKQVVTSESYQNLTLADPESLQYAQKVVAASSLVALTPSAPGASGFGLAVPAAPSTVYLAGGTDGSVATAVDAATLLGTAFAAGNPLAPLDAIAPSIFNILCMPSLANASDGECLSLSAQAMTFCGDRQAFFLLDIPPTVQTVDQMQTWAEGYTSEENYNAAVYFPRLVIPDPLNGYRPKNVGASGTMAGVYAATDAAVGVWKAPAGTDAVLQGATPAIQVTDAENGELNPMGVNVLRSFPVYGNLSWGARTLAGADQIDSDWKYIPVRRLVDYIESSLVQSLKWAVFQPNDPTLWNNISQEVGTFLQGLYNQGALYGAVPAQAYFVTCDATTTTATDIAQGIVNILIGVAPVDPAEFVILQIQQIAGQTS